MMAIDGDHIKIEISDAVKVATGCVGEKAGSVVPVAERKRPEETAMLSSMSESNVPAPPVSDAFEIAKAGDKHSNWYKQQLGLPSSILERAIKSFRSLIGRHESRIQNPTAEYPDFHQWDPRRQRNLIEHH